MTIAVRLQEGGRARPVRIAGEQARRLAAAGVVEVRPGPGSGTWLLRADRVVGAVRIGDVELYITPKVPVARLLFLLGYARDPKGWRDQPVPLAEQADLVPALADALWRQVDRATRTGLVHGYQPIDATSTVLRGRMREASQLNRWLGQPLPLEIRYDEFTADIAENRIMASAIDRMLRLPGVRPEARRMLRHLSARFPTVTRLRAGEPSPSWHPTRLNARVHTALRLADLVLAGASVDARRGGIITNGFLLDMATVFEQFLATSLRVALEKRYGGTLAAQAGGHLDHGRLIGLRPDLTWHQGGRVTAVVDAKYKHRMPAADAYQMLAYCTAYHLPVGHLVYVTGGTLMVDHVVRNSGTHIVCHSLDLGQPAEALLERVGRLADEIGRGDGR